MPLVMSVEAMIAAVSEGAEQGVNDAAQFLASEIQGSAPVATGTLRGGIHATPAEVGGNTVTATVTTSSESDDYSVVQEVGYWENFRGKYGYVAIVNGAPHYFQANVEAFGPLLEQYVAAAVAARLG